MGRKAESAAPAPPEPNPFDQLHRFALEAAEREKAEKEVATRAVKEAAAAAEKAKRAAERKEQLDAERCKLEVLPKIATLPYRSEISTEQACLFVSNSYKGRWFTHEATIKHPQSGEPITRRRTIGKVCEDDEPRGVLRSVHAQIWRKLLRLWGERRDEAYKLGVVDGEYYGSLSMSAYELVKALRGSDSEPHYNRVKKLLQDLKSIPIVLEHTYTWNGYVDRVTFTLLGDVKWTERTVDKKTGRPKPGGESRVTILFSSFVTEGFLRKHVKTVLGEPGKKLRGNGPRAELADLLYHFVNTQLATKDEYNVRLQGLVEQFGMTRYSRKSERLRQFTPALRAVHGARMLATDEREFFMHMSTRLAAGGDDYVLIASRVLHPPSEFVSPTSGQAQLSIPGIDG